MVFSAFGAKINCGSSVLAYRVHTSAKKNEDNISKGLSDDLKQHGKTL